MSKNERHPPKGSVGIDLTGSWDAEFHDVHITGYETPVKLDKGATLSTNRFSASKGQNRLRKSSGGWSGKEQFDPKVSPPPLDQNDPYFGPKLVLAEGTNKHIAEIEELSETFFASKPYARVAEIDPETGHLVHKLRANNPPPQRLSYATYSAINDLRNALDQAVCQSAVAINNRPAENAYFPFAESPKDLEGVLKQAKYSDIPEAIKPFLRSLEPYPTGDTYEGGNDLLRTFAKAANPNKHQVPLAIGARNLKGTYALKNMNARKLVDFFDPYWDSAKNEFVIARTAPGGTCDYDLEMPLYIAFDEIKGLGGKPVAATLRELATIVDSIVLGLEAETARILREQYSA